MPFVKCDALIRLYSTVALLAVFMSTVTAQERPREPSLDELEVGHLIDRASRVFEQHGLPIEEMSVDFQYRCLRAIGDTLFCECLLEKRPYTLRFHQYIGISSRTKTELDYDTLSDSGKAIVDRVFLVRDDCVAN